MENNNIQKGHSYEEYRKRFGHKFDKGKLLGFHENEIDRLNPKRVYWEINDKNAKYRYYQLPKYIKVRHVKSAYSLNKKINRHAVIKGSAIFCLLAILIGTSFVITRRLLTPAPEQPDVPVVPDVPLEELEKRLEEFGKWKKDNPDGDASKVFDVDSLAKLAVANTFFEYKEDRKVGEHYPKRNILSVGYGHTVSNFVVTVNVDISNVFMLDGDKTMDESISYGDNIAAPKVGRRDFFNNVEDHAVCYEGEAKSSKEITWKDEIKDEFNKETYINATGRDPMSPFYYVINKETLLEGSEAKKTDTGYEISMKLDPEKSVVNYIKRMKYLSKLNIKGFDFVELTFRTDDNMVLLESETSEKYTVLKDIIFTIAEVPTEGTLKTRFYHSDLPNIPSATESFDYSKYNF